MKLQPSKPPRPPAWLSATAKVKWKETARLLAQTGLLTTLDLDALAAYCECFANWRTAVETVEKEGATFTTPSGLVKRHPAVTNAQQANKDLLAWAERLGLTPAARQRMRVELPNTNEVDEFEALLNQSPARSRYLAERPGGVISRQRYPDEGSLKDGGTE
jgi:P27 family predicted phage terminase small subunit